MSNLQEKIMQDALGIKTEDKVCGITQQRIGGLFEDIGNELATKETPAGAQANAKKYTDSALSSYVSKRDAMRLFPDTVQSPLVDGAPVENKIVYCSGSVDLDGVHAMFGTGNLGFMIQANNGDIAKNTFHIAKTLLNNSGVDSGKYTWTDKFELFHTGNFNPSEYLKPLCYGSIDSNNTFTTTGCTVTKNPTDHSYLITHNYNSIDYILFVNSLYSNEYAIIDSKDINSFKLRGFGNIGQSDRFYNIDFVAYKI